MDYKKYKKYKLKYKNLIGGLDNNTRYRLILLSYETMDDPFKVITQMPSLYQFRDNYQTDFYIYVATQLLNNQINESDFDSIIRYFTTLEEENIRSECSVSLYYTNGNWIVIRDIKKGAIKTDLNNIWFVAILQYGKIDKNLLPNDLFKTLRMLQLIKTNKNWKNELSFPTRC